MSLASRNVLLLKFNPLVQTRRFKGKINIQKPKPPHWERAKFIELTKPWFINPSIEKTSVELCQKSVKRYTEADNVENPFQNLIAASLAKLFHNSRLIAFYHMNPLNKKNENLAQIMFQKENMLIKNFGKKTMQIALKGTKYEPVLEYYISRNMMVFSTEPDIRKLLKLSRKFPQLILLMAIYEGQLIDRATIDQLGQIPNLQSAQAGLVQTLNSAASNLTLQLNTHQNSLVANLQERIKQLEEEK